MKLQCAMCGKNELIDEDHPKYEYFIDKIPSTYICLLCTAKIKKEADDQHKPQKPI